MTLTEDELFAVLLRALDEHERGGGVAYLAVEPVGAGDTVALPRLQLTAPWDARLAFVDREPMANWSHSCRYLLIAHQTGEVISEEAQLPPFGPGARGRWRVAYKAAAIPDSVLPDLGPDLG